MLKNIVSVHQKKSSLILNSMNCVIIFLLSEISLQGCKKFTQIGAPTSQLSSPAIFSDSVSANAAITGIYSRMMQSNSFASGSFASITALAGLSSDELINYSPNTNLTEFFQNTLTSFNGNNAGLWDEIYQYIYTVNLSIERLSASMSLSPSLRSQLTGEAKFIRAFCNFYLANLYGPVPLITTTNYLNNAKASRVSTDSVYSQIISDLQAAQTSLPNDYSASNGQRVRPNQWAATFLLSRVYLYREQWQKAVDQATSIINNSSQFSLVTNFDSVFLANSSEAIWQLMPVRSGYNTNEGSLFILTDVPYNYSLKKTLVNAFSSTDNRRLYWTDSITVNGKTYYYPFKYKVQSGSVVTEYSMVFRLAEMYLVRAEANANLGNISTAQDDLNIIRNRAGLINTTATTKSDLIDAVLVERQLELFTEWGHRWFDLKRSNTADAVLRPLKGIGWSAHDTLYPIPQIEIQNDSYLSQNDGY